MDSFIKMFRSESRKQRGELWRAIKPNKHASRHRGAQMKAIGSGRFKGKSSRFGL